MNLLFNTDVNHDVNKLTCVKLSFPIDLFQELFTSLSWVLLIKRLYDKSYNKNFCNLLIYCVLWTEMEENTLSVTFGSICPQLTDMEENIC